MEVMIEMRLELENGGTFIRKYPGENVNIKCENFFDFFAFSNTHNKQCYLLCIFYIMQVLVLV